MDQFNRYLVEVEITSGGVEYTHTDTCTFSVAAISKSTARSAIPLNIITHVHDYEVTDIKKQNQ
jgi:hypothetical protein